MNFSKKTELDPAGRPLSEVNPVFAKEQIRKAEAESNRLKQEALRFAIWTVYNQGEGL